MTNKNAPGQWGRKELYMQYTTTMAVSQEQRRERAYETLLRDIAMSINNFKTRCKMIGDTEASCRSTISKPVAK